MRLMGTSPAHAALRDWMTRTGRTYGSVADALGVTDAHVSYLARGRRIPSLELAIKIANLTGIPVTAWARSTERAAV
jgi:transcriptional regulator with XRE-family HTH domain